MTSALPPDHHERLSRAMLSLEGLSCGDAFGESFFLPPLELQQKLKGRQLPAKPWPITDDTLMAISIVENLRRYGEIREQRLAEHFAHLFDPFRGYGSAMHDLLTHIRVGGSEAWQREANALFHGTGSYGNGSAMRVAPLGAYFASDLDQLTAQAERSAIATHTHPEAIAGAIAIALAAALAWNTRSQPEPPSLETFLTTIQEKVPPSEVRNGIDKALHLKPAATAREAGAVLGTGRHVTVMDTVPFVLWCAGSYLSSYEEALWQTVTPGGDKDTTCAMVGGIVVLRTGLDSIPALWRSRRESLAPLFTAAMAAAA